MKKLILTICLIMGFASTVYAGKFCCALGKTKEECCAERGKIYCPNENVCRTRCPDVTEPDCIGGCINPNGGCCTWCPSAEVCAKMNKCQKIGADGCYECVECDEACPSPKCLNQEGKCCDSCPRVCPAGQCLVNVNGCYQCGPCKGPTPPTPDDDDDVDDDDDDDDTETTEPNLCEGKDKYKDCKECDPSTGDYTIGGCGEGQVCCAGNCVSNQCDMMKCETFVGDLTDLGGSAVCKCVSNCSENEYCYTGDAASLGGSIRCCPNLEPIDEENCLTETCLYDDGGTSTLHGCPYRCSKCEAEETCSNGHCCAKGEVYIEAAQNCCPSARNCGHFCCGEGEYCASMDTVCCKTEQVLCNGECQDKPTVNENSCEKLSDDECSVISKCNDGQECDGAGNCVETSACEEGQKVCGTGENTWCCPSDNECGTNGMCCNSDKTTCCYSFEPYVFEQKTCQGDFIYEQTLEPTGSYDCCQCAGNQIWDGVAQKCVDCPSGSVKAGCSSCGLEKIFEYSDGYIDNYCYTFSANEHVGCANNSCGVCPKGETYYDTVGESLNTLEDFVGCCKQAPKMCDYSGYSMKVCGEDC